MPSTPPTDDRGDARVVRIAWIVVAVQALVFVLAIHSKSFNPDEFEHVHVAWNMKEGQLVYRDFVNMHGAFLPLFNSAVWWATGLPDETSTLVAFRWIGLLWPALVYVLTWAIAARTLGPRYGIVAVAVLCTSMIFLEKGGEIRPDGPQVACWLASVFFLIRTVQDERSRDAVLSGVMLGLSLVASPKMLTGAAAIGAFGALELARGRGRRRWVLATGMRIAGGAMIGIVPFALYFGLRGAFNDYYFYSLPVNILTASLIQGQHLGEQIGTFINTHFFILLTAPFGAWMFLRRKGPDGLRDRSCRCVLVVATVTGGFAMVGFVAQYYLVFLPLVAVVVSGFLVERVGPFRWRRGVVGVLLLLQLFVLGSRSFELIMSPHQRMQLELADFVLDHTREDEPVVFTGLDHGGYVFRPDLQYYWTNGDNLQRVFDHIEGHAVFGEPFVARMEEETPTFILSLSSEWAEILFPTEESKALLVDTGLSIHSYPEETRRYIEERYSELPGLHLLVRRDASSRPLREAARTFESRYAQLRPSRVEHQMLRPSGRVLDALGQILDSWVGTVPNALRDLLESWRVLPSREEDASGPPVAS